MKNKTTPMKFIDPAYHHMTTEELEDLMRAYQAVFLGNSTPEQGQLVYADLLMNATHVFGVNPHTNAQVYKTESKREVGLHLLYMCDLAPQLTHVRNSNTFQGLSNILETANQQVEASRLRALKNSKKKEDEDDD